MTSLWPHPPGTLRALKTILGDHYVICRRCQRYTDMRVPKGQEDRKFDPCPFRCSICRHRGDLVRTVPDGFERIGEELGPPAHRPSF